MVGWYKRYRLWLNSNFPEQWEILTSPNALCIQLVYHSPCHKLEESQPAEPFTDLSRDNSHLLNTSTACRLKLCLGLSQHRLELHVLDFVDLQWRRKYYVDRFHIQKSVKYTVSLQWLHRFSLLMLWLSVLHLPLSQHNPSTEGHGACTIW